MREKERKKKKERKGKGKERSTTFPTNRPLSFHPICSPQRFWGWPAPAPSCTPHAAPSAAPHRGGPAGWVWCGVVWWCDEMVKKRKEEKMMKEVKRWKNVKMVFLSWCGWMKEIIICLFSLSLSLSLSLFVCLFACFKITLSWILYTANSLSRWFF